jgi:hypothetical protein
MTNWEKFWSIFIVLLIFSFIVEGYEWVTDKLDDRNSRKERCLERSYNVKNEFTAKQMFKTCMKK